VRAIVVDPSCSVLLVRFEFEHWIGWATPGGGVDPGETDEEAIRRELAEEVGLEGFELGPLVWTRTHVLELADWDGQVEHYYFVRARKFDPVPRLTWAQLNAEHVTPPSGGGRWQSSRRQTRTSRRGACRILFASSLSTGLLRCRRTLESDRVNPSSGW